MAVQTSARIVVSVTIFGKNHPFARIDHAVFPGRGLGDFRPVPWLRLGPFLGHKRGLSVFHFGTLPDIHRPHTGALNSIGMLFGSKEYME